MNYVRDKDEVPRSRKSKSGSLRPQLRGGSGGHARSKKNSPQAIVAVKSWAHSPGSVKRMLQYIGRVTSLEEEPAIEEMEAEVAEKVEQRDFFDDAEEREAKFLREIVETQKTYFENIEKLAAERRDFLESIGKSDFTIRKEIYSDFELKRRRNLSFAKAHIKNMGDEYGIDVSVQKQMSDAFSEHDRRTDIISKKTVRLSKQFGNFPKIPDDKRKALILGYQKNADRLKSEIFEGAENLKSCRLKTVAKRHEHKQQAKHIKAKQGERYFLEDSTGAIYEGAYEIEKLAEKWSVVMERKQKGKRAPRHAAHIALSAKAENQETNVDKVLRAARRVAIEHFGDKGFDYAIGIHQDGKYPHAHLVVLAKNRDNGRKLALDPKDLHKVRQTFAKELTKRGLEHAATRAPRKGKEKYRPSNRQTKQDVYAETRALIANVEQEHRQFQRKLNRKRKEPHFDALRVRDAWGKSIDTQIKKLDSDTVLPPQRREKAKKLLSEISQTLQKGAKMDLETKATVNDLNEKMDNWTKRVEKTKEGQTRQDFQPHEKDDREKRRSVLDKEGLKIMKRVDVFLKKQLPNLPLKTEEKKTILRTMRQKHTGMKKIRERLRGRTR
ncbi:relaxase/mobilization nuclease domain-containing protein [Pseudodesulfovibrio senegalensis]|uniref:Relaxase/mobilization nuclease domain-containing protein n=1 Tax=Pseudodesulfovibrio senegalensis TaxID=1721087 RepID=A0A6N6MZ01_9BACT|nr:relaxase/mobilization nuclease domain-containing protein [Pseudodesulfovibrio senegalensis]KAB1437310.1 relaxase/mobilization nuclease domain-containing protein [Pseudodesulfovibrio senegalensis]